MFDNLPRSLAHVRLDHWAWKMLRPSDNQCRRCKSLKIFIARTLARFQGWKWTSSSKNNHFASTAPVYDTTMHPKLTPQSETEKSDWRPLWRSEQVQIQAILKNAVPFVFTWHEHVAFVAWIRCHCDLFSSKYTHFGETTSETINWYKFYPKWDASLEICSSRILGSIILIWSKSLQFDIPSWTCRIRWTFNLQGRTNEKTWRIFFAKHTLAYNPYYNWYNLLIRIS